MPTDPSDPRFSVEEEPWLKQRSFRPDPSEQRASRASHSHEIDELRDSVFNEPVHRDSGTGDAAYGEWMAERARRVPCRLRLLVTLTAALGAGPFAAVGAIVSGRQTGVAIVYAVLFGPVTEELLKQAGMIYLLERRPYVVFSRWQLVGGAAIAALVFAAIENLLYGHIYLSQLGETELLVATAFRWRVCTLMHVGCSLIASMGMVRVWKKRSADPGPVDLSSAYPYFAAAMAVHGGYNLVAVLSRAMWSF